MTEVRKASSTGELVAKYSYSANGSPSQMEYPKAGLVTKYAYNKANHITSLETRKGETILTSFKYTYLADGNISEKTDQKGVKSTYGYDAVGRLLQEQVGSSIVKYTYDKYGNRVRMETTGNEASVTTYKYDANNRLKEEETQEVSSKKQLCFIKYHYNKNRNLIQKENKDSTGVVTIETREYNGIGHVVKATINGNTINYSYRPDGLRNTKSAGTSETRHLWDGGHVVADVVNEKVSSSYLRGQSLLACEKDSTTYYYLFDSHGDVIGYTNQSGAIQKIYSYDAFGSESGQDSTDFNPFRFCGEYFDRETNTLYLRERDYAAGIGRFLSEDPIRDGVNWYIYCANNPIKFIDPSGLSFIDDVIAMGQAFAAGFYQRYQQLRQQKDILSFANYLTMGMVEANQQRGAEMLERPSVYTIGNWATSGRLGAAIRSVKPEKPLSLQHWMDSLGTALFIYTGYTGAKNIIETRNFVNSITPVKPTFTVDPAVTRALPELQKTNIRPGQTVISQSKVMNIYNNYNPTLANSSVYTVNNTRYLVEGHHTTVANTMLGRGSSYNMYTPTYQVPMVNNYNWYKEWYEVWKKTINILP